MILCPVVSVAVTFLGLSAAALAQQPALTPPATAQPPFFQGIMVDAKGKTVGRFFPGVVFFGPIGSSNTVVRQLGGVWVALGVDVVGGFEVTDPGNITFYYQSVDCTGQAYFLVNNPPDSGSVSFLVRGTVSTIPPSTRPSIYFAGSPASYLAINSARETGGSCYPVGGGGPAYVGPAQNVPLSNLGLTLPFSVK
jgi:hypothetical protein